MLQTDYNLLKQATAKNNHNLYTNLTLQQAYMSTLGAHIKNIYTKIGKWQSQIQQHCMYPHTPENSHSDTVQLLAPEFDPDIDGKNQLISTSNTLRSNNQQQQANPNIIDANKHEAENIQTQNRQFESNWPDAPTVQIPRVSSTTPDQPPEV